VALALEPFPRHLHAGAALRLRGEIAGRFDHASVYVTGADGHVSATRLEGRRIETDVQLATAGIHRVEVMGDGAGGPVVLANVPIYVDVGEPAAELEGRPPPDGTAAAAPEDAQARMLALLNDSRRAAAVPELVPDAELGAVALAHTQEMAAARALMASPSHRANMLDPAFTHVGIAVVIRPAERPALLATLVFARRPRALAASLTSAFVSDLLSSRRRARGAAPLRFDPLLQQAAEAGLEVALRGDAPVVTAAALDAAQGALARESKRLHQPRPAVCARLIRVFELEQLELELASIVSDPAPARVGLAAGTRKAAAQGAAGESFVLTVVEAATCK